MGSDQNSNQSSSTQINQGVSMNSIEFKLVLQQYYSSFVETTGMGNYTDFRKHVEKCMRDAVKPMTSRAAMSSSGEGNWRDQLKAQFKGRGRQWIWVSKESVQPTIDRLAAEGFDTVDYERWIATQDNAWVRFTGPRSVEGKSVGAFELRLDGSKIDCPKMLHYIPVDELDEENLNRMAGTPHSLGLEVDAPVANETEDEVATTPVEETEIPDQVPMTGLNEFFAVEETEEEYIDAMDMMDVADDFDEDLFSDC